MVSKMEGTKDRSPGGYKDLLGLRLAILHCSRRWWGYLHSPSLSNLRVDMILFTVVQLLRHFIQTVS